MVQYANFSLIEDAELSRLLADLATSDPAFASSLSVDSSGQTGRVGISTNALETAALQVSASEAVARLLRVSVFPKILGRRRDADTWHRGVQEFAVFKGMYKTALVPFRYEAADFKLGRWVTTRRTEKSRNKLSKEKIKQLDDMGFVWHVEEHSWQRGIQKLGEYKSEKGDLLVPQSHETSDGFKLGTWVSSRRTKKSRNTLNNEKIKQLDDMGFVWNVEEHLCQRGIQKLREYKSEKGDLLVPRFYETSDGFRLGTWVNNRRKEKSRNELNKEKMKQLDDIGFVWDIGQHLWQRGIQKLQEYKSEKGDLLVPVSHETLDGFKLGIWVTTRRTEKSRNKLNKEKIKQLDDMGFVWNVDEHMWQRGIQKLREYKTENGDLLVPASHETSDGFKLGGWVFRRRKEKSLNTLNKAKVKQLYDIGFVWDVEELLWQRGIQKLREYKTENGDLLVPASHETSDGFKLGIWVNNRRREKSQNKLDKEKIKQLDDMVFVWDISEYLWQEGIQNLREYKSQKGDLLVPQSHETSDGFKLGTWVKNRRTEKSRNELNKEKTKQLDDMGFVWDMRQHLWQRGIQKLREYKSEKGDLLVPRFYETSDGFRLGTWVNNRRKEKSRNELNKEKMKQLDDIGFVWDVDEHMWQRGIQKLGDYKSEKGDLLVPASHETSDGFKLGIWVNARRTEKSRNTLNKEKIKQLDDMGFVWHVEEHLWQRGIQKLGEYKSQKGDLLVPQSHETLDGFKLGGWVFRRRKDKSRNKLDKEKIKQLDDMGFVWDVGQHLWQRGIQKLREYKSEKGDLLVPQSHETLDGSKLGIWVKNRRTEKSRNELNKEKIKQLDDMGFVWDASQLLCQRGIQKLREYKSAKTNLFVPRCYETSDAKCS